MQTEDFMNHFYAFTGKFMDIKSLILFKYFAKALQIDNLNIHMVLENDLYQSYLLNLNSTVITEDKKVFVVYGINTKLENSIYNLKLRKLQMATNSLIYYIGNKIDINYKIVHIGLTLSNLLETYYGSTEICYDIVNSTNTYFLSGKGSFTDEYNNVHLIKKLDLNLIPNIEFLYNNLFSGDVSALDLNIKSKIYCNIEDKDLEIPKFIYFLGFENFQTLELNYNNLFIIYHGHHFNMLSNRANVLIPSPTFIEKNGFFMDCYGLIHQNNPITLTRNCYDEHYIIHGL
jgi:NADH-quinone oxidoreductase subunit G